MEDTGQFPSEDLGQQILRRLSNIEHKVDSMDQTAAFAMRADAQRHFDSVRRLFRKNKRRAQVYLAANGRRSVQEIANLLGMKSPHVSRALSKLQEDGLLKVLESEGGRNYWGKKSIDRTVGISKLLMEEFDLGRDGLPKK